MGQGPAHEVYLWPADNEWECDCESSADACAHAVAALCGLRSGLDALPQAETPPHIIMQLSRKGRWLDLQLAVRRGESVEPCPTSLPTDVLPSEELRRLRQIQGSATGKRVASRHYRALMSALLAEVEVTLDGQPVGQSSSGSITVNNVFRGTHEARAHIVDENGVQVKTGSPITFTVHRPSALN